MASTKKSSTNRSSQTNKRASASAKTGTHSSGGKGSVSSRSSTMDKEHGSLLRAFFQSPGGRLIILIVLLVLMSVITLLLTRDDPQTFFRITGIEILLLWGILVIYSLVRRRNND